MNPRLSVLVLPVATVHLAAAVVVYEEGIRTVIENGEPVRPVTAP
jgi:hypothetical protein